MLSRVVKEHNQKQAAQKDLQELRKREAAIEASKLTYRLMDTLNSGVENAYVNQRKLETEAKKLQAHVVVSRANKHFEEVQNWLQTTLKQVQYSKQTTLWLKMVESFNQSLKELGDVENWSRVIEADMTSIASALEYAYKGDGPQSADLAS